MHINDIIDKPQKIFEKSTVIAISSSNLYVPYLSALVQSILEHKSATNNYDIIVLNKDITYENKEILSAQCDYDNVSIRFFNMSDLIDGKNFYFGKVAVEAYFRVFLPDILEEYEKVVFLDCDVVVNKDVAELYSTNIEDYYLAAVRDPNLIGCYHQKNHWKPYLDNVLELKNPYDYIQSGVLVMNLSKIRNEIGVERVVEVCTSYEWKLLDQDVLNKLFQGAILVLENKWNVMTGNEGRGNNMLNNTPTEISEDYKLARENPHIIHYCGSVKPWIVAEVEFGAYFWGYARKCPYYEMILERKNKSDIHRFIKEHDVQKSVTAPVQTAKVNTPTVSPLQKKDIKLELKPEIRISKEVAVFRVLSVYQLLSAINLKLTSLKNATVDLIVSGATDFGNSIKNLQDLKLFRNIYLSEDTPQDYFQWKTYSADKREQILIHPEENLYLLDFPMDYTDYYFATPDPYNKLFYYHMVKEGLRPNVHIFEDGLSTYLIDFIDELNSDIWTHEIYGDLHIKNFIKELIIYEPDFYVGNMAATYAVNNLPKIDYKNKRVVEIFNKIFGKNELPKEKFIFLEEPFMWDHLTATDMELVELLADFVGKENVRVKLHPRNKIDRFTPRGYKIFENTTIPWEMTMLNSDVSKSILVTVSSTSAMTAGMVFDKPFNTINLFDLIMIGSSVHVRNPKFKELYPKMEQKYNSQVIQVKKPKTIEEFKETLLYMEGKSNDGTTI